MVAFAEDLLPDATFTDPKFNVPSLKVQLSGSVTGSVTARAPSRPAHAARRPIRANNRPKFTIIIDME
jgi:hypothetical protein